LWPPLVLSGSPMPEARSQPFLQTRSNRSFISVPSCVSRSLEEMPGCRDDCRSNRSVPGGGIGGWEHDTLRPPGKNDIERKFKGLPAGKLREGSPGHSPGDQHRFEVQPGVPDVAKFHELDRHARRFDPRAGCGIEQGEDEMIL